MQIVRCDIVLLPERKLFQKAVVASETLERFGGLFVLGDEKAYPHLSLYMVQLPVAAISGVNETLEKIASGHSLIRANSEAYCLSQGRHVGYIDTQFSATAELYAIQEDVVQVVAPMRAGTSQKDTRKLRTASGVLRDNLQKYGYRSIGKLFRPHMTLTRLDVYKPEVLGVLPDASEFSGIFDRIGLFELGENGTCIRKILEFPLANRN